MVTCAFLFKSFILLLGIITLGDKGGRCSYQKYKDCSSHIKEKTIFPNRIHGGVEAVPYSHPSAVLLAKPTGFCGAVIIAEDWALTAAHCVVAVTEQEINLIGGQHIFPGHDPTEQRISQVKKIHECPDFDPDPNVVSSDDICLLELYDDEKFTFNQFVNYAELAPASYKATGKATLVGWGFREDGSFLGPLHEVEMTIISHLQCRSQFWDPIGPKDICTYDKGKSSCSGDSGGPLYQVINGVTFVVGIESNTAPNCSFGDTPTVYAEVSEYWNWILKERGLNIVQTTKKQNPLTVVPRRLLKCKKGLC